MDCGRCGLSLPGTKEVNGQAVWWDGDEVKCADCETVNRITVYDEDEAYVQGWTCKHGSDDETACPQCDAEDEAARQMPIPPDLKILSFEIRGIERPGRVYCHGTGDGSGRMIVAFNEPAPRSETHDENGKPKRSTFWSGLPTMFLYVKDFDAALPLAREIAAAHKAGNVDAYIGRWKRECAESEERAKGQQR